MSLTEKFRSIFARLTRVIRWEGYEKRHYLQTSFEHSVFISLLMAYFINEEEKYGNKLSSNLVAFALLHDYGEGAIGDILFKAKMDPRLKYILNPIEKEEAFQMFEQLPNELGEFFKSVYSQEIFTDKEKHFFVAIECMEYLIYALNEYEHGNKDFVKALARQKPRMENFCQEFGSINNFYQKYLQEKVVSIIKNEQEFLKANQHMIRKTTEKDITFLEDVIAKLRMELNSEK